MKPKLRFLDKKQQRERLLKKATEAKRRAVLYGVGTDYAMISNGLRSLEPKFSYTQHCWIRAAKIAYSRRISIEDLAQLADWEILCVPNAGRKTLRWIRENYPADYVASQ